MEEESMNNQKSVLSVLLVVVLMSFSNHAYSQSARDMMREFSEMFEDQNRRMNEMFNQFFERHEDDFGDLQGIQFRSHLGGFSQTDIRQVENDRHIIFELDEQGIDLSALDVTMNGGMITISGQIRQDNQSEDGNQFFQSTSISSFSRSFPVPAGVEHHTMRVEKGDGVIQIIFDRRMI